MKFTNTDDFIKNYEIYYILYLKLADYSYWQARLQVRGQIYNQIIPIRNKISEEPHKLNLLI